MMGADEYGFGTSVLVAMGCDMARQCHLNTCPTGIATQRADLRAKFAGTPEMIETYFRQLTQGIREMMADLGVRRLDELIGRTDLLRSKLVGGRASKMNLADLLPQPADSSQRRHLVVMDRSTPDDLSERLWAQLEPLFGQQEEIALSSPIQTADRTVGARIAGNLVMRRRAGKPVAPVRLAFRGSAGQSFGAFAVDGMTLVLEGEANDYVGKGLNGGTLVLRPDRDVSYSDPQAIAGNTLLYGATGGEAFFAGQAGERFAVRNSGATTVVEGIGDHGCEYMTGGRAVVLGPGGFNFGAGMTNGQAWVLDEDGTLEDRINSESVHLDAMRPQELEAVRNLVERHVALTGSAYAADLLQRWDEIASRFRSVVPKALLELQALREEEESLEQGAAD
jgi:glutamate synthase domain-containing protein 3